MCGNENGEIKHQFFSQRLYKIINEEILEERPSMFLNDDGDVLISLQRKKVLGKSQVHSIIPAASC